MWLLVLLFLLELHFTNAKSRDKACDMLVVVDETLHARFGHHDGTIINLVDEHIDGLNQIFQKQMFTGQYSEYYFYVKNIELWYDFCEHCNQTQEVFLSEFSKYDTSGYCDHKGESSVSFNGVSA